MQGIENAPHRVAHLQTASPGKLERASAILVVMVKGTGGAGKAFWGMPKLDRTFIEPKWTLARTLSSLGMP